MEKLSNWFKLENACKLIGGLDFIIYLTLTFGSAFFFGTDILDMEKVKYFAHRDIYIGLSRFGVNGEAMRANAKVDDLEIILGDTHPWILLSWFYNFNAISISDGFITFLLTLVFFFGTYFSYMLVKGCRMVTKTSRT